MNTKRITRFVGVLLVAVLTISMFVALAGSVIKAQRDMKDRTFEMSEAIPPRELDECPVWELDEDIQWELDEDIQWELDQDLQRETHEDSDGGFQAELCSGHRNKIGSYVTDTPI